MQKKQLTVSNRNFIAEQITQALTYMHTLSLPMIHRDIKPSNVLVRIARYHLCTSCYHMLQVEESTLHVYLRPLFGDY